LPFFWLLAFAFYLRLFFWLLASIFPAPGVRARASRAPRGWGGVADRGSSLRSTARLPSGTAPRCASREPSPLPLHLLLASGFRLLASPFLLASGFWLLAWPRVGCDPSDAPFRHPSGVRARASRASRGWGGVADRGSSLRSTARLPSGTAPRCASREPSPLPLHLLLASGFRLPASPFLLASGFWLLAWPRVGCDPSDAPFQHPSGVRARASRAPRGWGRRR
jgi:hypothetical protein